MGAAEVVDLVGKLAWPAVILVLVLLFRRNLHDLLARLREFEGPGDVRVKLDRRQVEQIVEEGSREQVPPREIAKRIVEQAIVDPREFRILRALIAEDEGRGMYSYRSSYYKPALDAKQAKAGRKCVWVSGGTAARGATVPAPVCRLSSIRFPLLQCQVFL